MPRDSSLGTGSSTSLSKVLKVLDFQEFAKTFFPGGLALATALLTGLLAAGFGRRYSAKFSLMIILEVLTISS